MNIIAIMLWRTFLYGMGFIFFGVILMILGLDFARTGRVFAIAGLIICGAATIGGTIAIVIDMWIKRKDDRS